MNSGKVVEVVTVQPKQYKMTVKKLCRSISSQIAVYVEQDQDKMECKL